MNRWVFRFGVVAFLCCGQPGHAELANAIKAIVNDAVITYQEVELLNQQTEDLVVRKFRSSPSMLEKEINRMQTENLDKLVEQQLILHEFKTAGYSLPESVLDDLVQETIKNDFGDRATLTKTLEARGISYEKFRQQIRERFIVSQLRMKNVSSEIIISPHKIESYYLAHRDDFKEEDRIKLRKIILSKSSDPNLPDPRKLGEEIVSRLREGASFSQLAAIYSQEEIKNREAVWYDRSALRKELADPAFTLKAGQCSDVIDAGTEFYVLSADEVSTAHYKTLSEVRAKIEQTLRGEERDRLEKKWIDKLKKKTFVQYFL
jgi:peptidyl-prolyl cis-trans isomerase SurA